MAMKKDAYRCRSRGSTFACRAGRSSWCGSGGGWVLGVWPDGSWMALQSQQRMMGDGVAATWKESSHHSTSLHVAPNPKPHFRRTSAALTHSHPTARACSRSNDPFLLTPPPGPHSLPRNARFTATMRTVSRARINQSTGSTTRKHVASTSLTARGTKKVDDETSGDERTCGCPRLVA